jgi:hypothetical protein
VPCASGGGRVAGRAVPLPPRPLHQNDPSLRQLELPETRIVLVKQRYERAAASAAGTASTGRERDGQRHTDMRDAVVLNG